MDGERSGNGDRIDRNLHLNLPSLQRSESREDLTAVSSLRSRLSPFSHASALYSPSNALTTPDILPANLLPAIDSAAIYHPHSSSESQQPLDEPSTVPNLHGREPLAGETLWLVPLREVAARPWARDCDFQTYSSPPPQPFPRSGPSQVESVSALNELTAPNNALSLHQELREQPEHRFQLLIELLQTRRSANPDVHSLTCPERLHDDIMLSHRAMETAKKASDGEGGEDLGKKSEDIAAANFQCNVCYELANSPVVTPCGHLYCWSCLYQWLHAHAVNSECPVCKGQVLEGNVTPIYGRGGEESKESKHRGGVGESNLKIPPRPSANRVENLRLQPTRGRLEEGITNSRRNTMHEETHDSRRQGRSGAARTVVRRRPVRSLHLEEGIRPNSAGVVGVVPEGLAEPLSSSDSAEPLRHTAGSVTVVDQASTSNAIAASLGGTATASPSAGSNPALAASGGAHRTRRRMR